MSEASAVGDEDGRAHALAAYAVAVAMATAINNAEFSVVLTAMNDIQRLVRLRHKKGDVVNLDGVDLDSAMTVPIGALSHPDGAADVDSASSSSARSTPHRRPSTADSAGTRSRSGTPGPPDHVALVAPVNLSTVDGLRALLGSIETVPRAGSGIQPSGDVCRGMVKDIASVGDQAAAKKYFKGLPELQQEQMEDTYEPLDKLQTKRNKPECRSFLVPLKLFTSEYSTPEDETCGRAMWDEVLAGQTRAVIGEFCRRFKEELEKERKRKAQDGNDGENDRCDKVPNMIKEKQGGKHDAKNKRRRISSGTSSLVNGQSTHMKAWMQQHEMTGRLLGFIVDLVARSRTKVGPRNAAVSVVIETTVGAAAPALGAPVICDYLVYHFDAIKLQQDKDDDDAAAVDDEMVAAADDAVTAAAAAAAADAAADATVKRIAAGLRRMLTAGKNGGRVVPLPLPKRGTLWI